MLDNEILERFGVRVRTAIYKARYNCAPTQDLAVIIQKEDPVMEFYRWGLIPYWAKDKSIGNKMINARAETIMEKPSFRKPFRTQRCLIPATGFFEWKRAGTKIPFNIRLKGGIPFAFAGLWDRWMDPEGQTVYSFTIITVPANERISDIHDRMPVILHRNDEQRWLGPGFSEELTGLLKPYPAGLMEMYPVSGLVNSVGNDRAEILEPRSEGT